MDHRNNPLDRLDRFHLNAASGWLGLGDVVSAGDELEQISPDMQARPEVLLVKSEIYFAAKNWNALLPVAETLLQEFPKLDSLGSTAATPCTN